MAKPPKDKRRQKRFTHKPDPEAGYNAFEQHFMHAQEEGPYALDPMYHEPANLEFFSEKRLRRVREKFAKKFSQQFNNLDEIEACVKAYAQSSSADNVDLLKFKLSLLQLDEELLPALYGNFPGYLLRMEFQDEQIIQAMDTIRPIPKKSLKYYAKLTRELVAKEMHQFALHLDKKEKDHVHHKEDINIFRGIGNRFYYQEGYSGTDFLSIYTGEDEMLQPFHELQLLTSYSLSSTLAEAFMTMKNNQRRVFITTDFETLEREVVASFITSPSFREHQFEFLVRATSKTKIISQTSNDEIVAFFTLSLR